jgi:hypothetical protein
MIPKFDIDPAFCDENFELQKVHPHFEVEPPWG